MRYMATELQLTRLRHDFEYAWQEVRIALGDPPSESEVVALLMRAREFVLAVDNATAAETLAWISEFQTGLADVETSLGGSARV